MCPPPADNAWATLKSPTAEMRKLKPIRIRFGIRLLLVVTAALAGALYVLYVRPTSIANRFVVAVMRHDYHTAKSLVTGRELWGLDDGIGNVDQVYAEVLPPDWEDIRKCQRKVIFRLIQHQEEGGKRVDWTDDTDLVAEFNGVKIATPVIDLSTLAPVVIEFPSRNDPIRVPDYTLLP
jgi:hypothetical protein